MTSSSENANVIVIGKGSIGSAVSSKIRSRTGWNIAANLSRTAQGLQKGMKMADGFCKFDPQEPATLAEALPLEDVDLAFLAIPTIEEGRIALGYMQTLIGHGVPVVTCEKGSVSNFYADLVALGVENIGTSATVGGGTRMLSFLKNRRLRDSHQRAVAVNAVLNGTLNYIFSETSGGGRSLPEAVDEAIKLQITEPGAEDPLDIIRGEMADVVMKASALFNIVLSADGGYLSPDMFDVSELDEKGLSQLAKRAYRYVVSFSSAENGMPEGLIGAMRASVNGWNICGGFYPIAESPIPEQLLPVGVNNAVVVAEGPMSADGIYRLEGPGAGPRPTAEAMMTDAMHLLSARQ